MVRSQLRLQQAGRPSHGNDALKDDGTRTPLARVTVSNRKLALKLLGFKGEVGSGYVGYPSTIGLPLCRIDPA